METTACHEIFDLAELRRVRLIWSFMHADESALCPIEDRRQVVFWLSRLCRVRVGPKQRIHTLAQEYCQKALLSPKDALHLAAAVVEKAAFFISCDDMLLRRANRLRLPLACVDPIQYFRREVM